MLFQAFLNFKVPSEKSVVILRGLHFCAHLDPSVLWYSMPLFCVILTENNIVDFFSGPVWFSVHLMETSSLKFRKISFAVLLRIFF